MLLDVESQERNNESLLVLFSQPMAVKELLYGLRRLVALWSVDHIGLVQARRGRGQAKQSSWW